MTFWWRSFRLSEGLRPCEDLRTSWSGGIRMLPCILSLRNTIILKRRGGWSTVFGHSQEGELCVSLMFQGVRDFFVLLCTPLCNLSLSKRDFFVLLYYNTQSYWIRDCFVSLSYFLNINKSGTFSVLLFVLTFLLHWKSDKWLPLIC